MYFKSELVEVRGKGLLYSDVAKERLRFGRLSSLNHACLEAEETAEETSSGWAAPCGCVPWRGTSGASAARWAGIWIAQKCWGFASGIDTGLMKMSSLHLLR